MTQQSNTDQVEFKMSVILYLVCWSHSAGAPPLPPLRQCPEVSHLHCSQLLHWHLGWWDTCNNSTHSNFRFESKRYVYKNPSKDFQERYYSDIAWFIFVLKGLRSNSGMLKRKGGKGYFFKLMRKQWKDVMSLLVQCQHCLTQHHSLHLLFCQSHSPQHL